jgi:hypothetical protein
MRSYDSRSFFKFILALILLLDPLRSVYASDDLYDYYFRKFSRDSDTRVGLICEKIALEELAALFSPMEYYFLTNLIYVDDEANDIGELDFLIMEKETGFVIRIAEVKCWYNRVAALEKAEQQLQRFRRHLRDKIYRDAYGCTIKIRPKEGISEIPCDKFGDLTQYLKILPRSSKTRSSRGFTLPFSVEEIHSLSNALSAKRFSRNRPVLLIPTF